MRAAVFLDRDGVLLEEVGNLVDRRAMRLLPGAVDALQRLADGGYTLAVVTNQPVVGRGLATEAQVAELLAALGEEIVEAGGPELAGFYFCPHHPNADLEQYRLECTCRKPRPGLLVRAAAELEIDLGASFMVGDRISDVAAGARAGCRTILVHSGAHSEPPIESPEPPDPGLRPDHVCDDLASAADWILSGAG